MSYPKKKKLSKNFFLEYVSLLTPHFIKIWIYIYINRIIERVFSFFPFLISGKKPL